MDEHEKEKRGRVAELMYELLDFGRMEQLARDIWDKAPDGVKREVADLFAHRIKSEITRQAVFVEPAVDQYGRPKDYQPPKPLMQIAFEKVVGEMVEGYIAAHREEIRTQVIAKADEQLKARIESESKRMLDLVFQKARDGIDRGLRGY